MDIKKFYVDDKNFSLKDHSTDFTGKLDTKDEGKKLLKENIDKMRELQEMLYAQDKQALLIIFQAMDAAGKDGAIKHVMSGLNPQGTQVFSFKQPSKEELDHDYLWRHNKSLPERGRIGIFNRSYYEEVLIVRVHNLVEQQKLPKKIINRSIWQTRFRQINDYEKYLYENGIRIIKFFINISKEEQKERFIKRIDRPEKNWKFSEADLEERKFWNDYQKYYNDMLTETSKEHAPWFIIPGDKKWFARYAISNIIIKTMESMDLKFPEVTEERRKYLLDLREKLVNES